MVTRREFYLALVVALAVGVTAGSALVRDGAPAGIRVAEAQMLGSEPSSFASVAKRAMPSVVNVFTTQRIQMRRFGTPFGPNDPFNEFFREFFRDMPRDQERQSLGSGFILDAAGYVLTNQHVVANANEIRIKLTDARSFPAKLIGSDPRTDLALVRIEGKNLPAAALGDSDALKVGDWVLAIGNPFGLEATVTAGIVSATERVIGAGPYDNFIQTDASVNPGNSGGPLIDGQGRVVGVNTAIFSQSGGSVGIGFAIPINLAKDVLLQLRDSGRVVRGYLGVSVVPVTEDVLKARRLPARQGAVVAEVSGRSPAATAGLQAGDVIVAFGGRDVTDPLDLTRRVAQTAPGTRTDVTVVRDGARRTVQVTVGQLRDRPE